MSNNDALERAARALRDTGETPAADVARTRARVLETLHRGERRGRRTFWVLLPIAAVLAASTALAKNTDAVRRVWTSVAETMGIVTPAAKSAPLAVPPRELAARPGSDEKSPHDVLPAPTAEVVPPIPFAEQPAGAAPDIEPGSMDRASQGNRKALPSVGAGPVAASRSRRTNVAEGVPSPSASNPPAEAAEHEAPAAPSPNDGEAAALQLYKNAYRLHFVEQRYAAALTAWDEYLRAVPAGRLVVEARYNRAIALTRLGRRAEAEGALLPFARGEVSGGYRAREARELMDALRASSH
jgi:hypothetical protein